jgi:hypothetical protein
MCYIWTTEHPNWALPNVGTTYVVFSVFNVFYICLR